MQTRQESFLEFLGQENVQFVVPMYQRSYTWLKVQSEELWEDILEAGRKGASHYMSMTLLLDTGVTDDGVRCFDIIDGQQRISTLVIILAAFESWLREGSRAFEGPTADEIRKHYLTVDTAAGTECKIKLTRFDRETLAAVLGIAKMPERNSKRVLANYRLFRELMDAEGFDPTVFWSGIQQLVVVDAELDEKDKAQAIFESLNTKGLPLSAADLIRNYLLVGENREEQNRLYEEYWSAMEMMYADDVSSTAALKLNTGLRMWLTMQSRGMRIKDRSRTYSYFKSFMLQQYKGTTEELLDELRAFNYMWAENYKHHPGRTHCSTQEWAKGVKRVQPPAAARH